MLRLSLVNLAHAVALLLCGVVSCTGTVSGPSMSGSAGDGGNAGEGGQAGATMSDGQPPPARLHRLTNAEFTEVTRDLLGTTVLPRKDLEPDAIVARLAAVGASKVSWSDNGIERFESAAREIAEEAFAAPSRTALVDCTPRSADDEECMRGFMRGFLQRAFRRPASDEEVKRYLAVGMEAAGEAGDFWYGAERAVAAALQSPKFLYRVEIGEVDPDRPTRRRYTAYELASRLSFFVWNTMPDADLFESAASGKLLQDEELRAQTRRLLASPRARVAWQEFVEQWFELPTDEMKKDAVLFPAMSPTLAAAMRKEVLLRSTDLVFERNADWLSLYNSRDTFVNAELAALYGIAAPNAKAGADGFAPVQLSASGLRLGLLGSAAVLARQATSVNTQPTRRGRFVLEALLCQTVLEAPPDVDMTLPTAPSPTARTRRQRLDMHASVPRCRACHNQLDPPGFALENFDAIGAFRDKEESETVDASGTFDEVEFADLRGFADILSRHPDAASCAVKAVYRWANGQHEDDGQAATLDKLIAAFAASGHRMTDLMEHMVLSDDFRYVGP